MTCRCTCVSNNISNIISYLSLCEDERQALWRSECRCLLHCVGAQMWDEPGDKAEVSRDRQLPVRFTKPPRGGGGTRGARRLGDTSYSALSALFMQGRGNSFRDAIITHTLALTEMKKQVEVRQRITKGNRNIQSVQHVPYSRFTLYL